MVEVYIRAKYTLISHHREGLVENVTSYRLNSNEYRVMRPFRANASAANVRYEYVIGHIILRNHISAYHGCHHDPRYCKGSAK